MLTFAENQPSRNSKCLWLIRSSFHYQQNESNLILRRRFFFVRNICITRLLWQQLSPRTAPPYNHFSLSNSNVARQEEDVSLPYVMLLACANSACTSTHRFKQFSVALLLRPISWENGKITFFARKTLARVLAFFLSHGKINSRGCEA